MSDNWITRRKSPRRSFTRKVGVLKGGIFEISEARQIGEGGMLYVSPVKVPEGTQIVLTFVVPGRAHIVVRGEVRYNLVNKSGESCAGVQFVGLPFEQRRAIRHYVADKSEGEAHRDRSQDDEHNL